MKKLPEIFFRRHDVVEIAKELIGKLIVTNFDGALTSGRIVETEAYNGATDRASHAYGNRRTARTEVMFGAGGIAYVYLCYGIHHMFNIVTNENGIPHAILIRGIEPVDGKEIMMARMQKAVFNKTIGKGPGNVSKALGIQTSLTGCSLSSDELFVADDGFEVGQSQIIATPRIGIDYAGEDTSLLYRFLLKDNLFVSGRRV